MESALDPDDSNIAFQEEFEKNSRHLNFFLPFEAPKLSYSLPKAESKFQSSLAKYLNVEGNEWSSSEQTPFLSV